MASRYIRAQALTLTKAHEERAGPLNEIAVSVRKYGFDDPSIVYSDDPTKVIEAPTFLSFQQPV